MSGSGSGPSALPGRAHERSSLGRPPEEPSLLTLPKPTYRNQVAPDWHLSLPRNPCSLRALNLRRGVVGCKGMFVLLASLLFSLRGCLQTRAALHAENLALRHQLLLLQRVHQNRRLRLRSCDRLVWVWLSRVWPNWRSALCIVKPETVIDWHRQGFRLYWKWEKQSSSWSTVGADRSPKPERIAVGVPVVAGAFLLMGQARSNRTMEAEKFILRDGNGTVRARLEMEPMDRPTLVLLDAKGVPLVSLGAGESPFLNICTGDCKRQVQVGTFSNEIFGLALYDKDKGPLHGVKAALGVVKGVPGLNLFSEDSAQQASLDLEGGPRLLLSDQNGIVSLEKASVEVSDKQGFITKIGSTDLETPRTGETHKTSAASIVLIGKDGKALWTAP